LCDAFLANEVGPAPLRMRRMTVSGDPVDRFGLRAFVTRCVSRLTEGAQSELARQKTVGIELI
jgi:hypothetical protein